jgi:hypothetical protein
MGSLDPQWIIPGTLGDYGTAILSLLATRPRTASVAPLSSAPASPGKRKVLISGAYARLGSPWPWDKNLPSYVFIRNTLSAMDVSDLPEVNLPSSNGGRADTMNFTTYDSTLGSIWSDSQYVNIPGVSDDRSPIGFWSQTFEYTNNAAYFQIASTKDDPGHTAGDPFLLASRENSLQVTVQSPANGAKLTESFRLDLQSSKPVTHLLYYSLDGATWTRLGAKLRGNQHRLTTSFLPPTDHLTLRIRSSDGFSTVVNTITGLSLNSSPQVVITEPRNSRVLSPVTLSALAGDASGRTLSDLNWSSSIDGNLGQGESLPAVTLSPGTHTLTCTLTLPTGQSASCHKEITVAASDSTVTDPCLTSNSLEVVSACLPPGILALNRTNLLHVTAFASTAAAEGFLRVYAQAPGAEEQLLTEIYLQLDQPRLTRTVPYRPTTTGDHRIRAVLFQTSPDANPANNEFAWTIPVQPVGISVTMDPPEALAAGAQWRIGDGSWNEVSAILPASDVQSVPALINFKPLPGWQTPMPYYVDKDLLGNMTFKAKYRLDQGSQPYISPVPASKFVGLDSYVTLSYYVSGRPTPKYFWYKDGQLLAGSNTASLRFPSVQLSNAGTYFLTASNTAGLFQSMPISLVITNAGMTFASWSQQWPGLGTASDDFDGDGIPNLLEYALGLNPTRADRQGLPSAGIHLENNVAYLTLAYTRPKQAADVTYSVLTTDHLGGDWDNPIPARNLSSVEVGEYLSITVGIPILPTTGLAGFIYLRVSRP